MANPSIPPGESSVEGLGMWLTQDYLRYDAATEALRSASTVMATASLNAPYRLIYELGNAFACQLDLDSLLQLVTHKCREVLAAEGAAILLLDPEGQELYFPYLADLDPEVARRLAGVRFPAALGIAGEALRSGRALKVDDVSREQNFYSLIDRHTGLTTRSLLAAPLIFADSRLGVVEVVNSTRDRAFSDDDLVLLEALADSISSAIKNAAQVAQLMTSERTLRAQVGALRRDLAKHELLDDIAGTSPPMMEVFRLIASVSASPISVLIEGETGTGKELVARALHRMSDRADRPFLAVNCAALSEHLLESELFGHRRGAFTGAINDQPGLFKAASGGVIFLDEIGEMPLPMQPKLLRVLQDGEIIPVGSTRPERVDVRVLSASNRDLQAAVDSRAFRADLYYRLATFPITLPPLREREGDIPLLAARFLAAASARQHKSIRDIEPAVLALFERYGWPGNVRELQNEIERAVALTPAGESITPERLSTKIRADSFAPAFITAPNASPLSPPQNPAQASSNDNGDLRFARADFEARHIARVLASHQGNVSRAAKALGISRISLQRKLKDYRLRSSD
ncbi:MAG TPA: sigma 54-interacting transcriptional regulator [Candidatus Binataceae bacterium]|nr:sigma 54-interacting transcriptional regulator [Candidatus Binataceae bacterium]